MRSSIIKDSSLAPEGHRKIRWVEAHSPVLNALFERRLSDGTLRGLPIAVCVPLEAKTADVTLAGTAPGYVQDDVAAAVASSA